MADEVRRFAYVHKQAFENGWTHGSVKYAWYDADGVLCIMYQDGNWWHYRDADGNIEWW